MSDVKDQTVQLFLNQLASKASTPGGGSSAAIMGAQAAALISMVCNLTIGKPKYAQVDDEMQTLLKKSEALREKLTGFIKADIDAFNRVMSSYGLPKETQQESSIRHAAIQTALKAATEVPLSCAYACAETIELSRSVAEKGNINVVSDAGVAVMSAYAALKSAALNVYINLGSIDDQEFVTAGRTRLEGIMADADAAAEEIYQFVKSKL